MQCVDRLPDPSRWGPARVRASLEGLLSAIIPFSNRCFPNKAIAIWHQLDDQGHVRLVEVLLYEAGNFENIRSLDRSPQRMVANPLHTMTGENAGLV